MTSEVANTRRRGYKRQQVTKLCTKIDEEFENMTANEISESLAKLDLLGSEVRALDEKIYNAKFKATGDDEENGRLLEEAESVSDQIFKYTTMLKNSSSFAENSFHNHSLENSGSSKLMLPKVSLPTFSHSKDQSLESFLQSFEGIVNRHNVGNYEKFCLLKQQLKGEALVLVNSLPVEKHYYNEARDLLIRAFANDTIQKFEAIKRLSELRLLNDSNVYEFVGEMRTVECLFNTLKIEIVDILQYFIWNGMNNSLQTQLINICNNNKPDLDDIRENIFKGIDRYLELKQRKNNIEKTKASPSISNFAVNLDPQIDRNRKLYCTLCSVGRTQVERTHSTKDCPVYPRADMKTKQLKLIGACSKCGYGNHTTNQCKFIFKRKCFNCKKDHMTFLCDLQNKEKGVTKPAVTSAHVVCTSALKAYCGNSVILPTFSGTINSKVVRGMKDSGSQPHFIKTSLAEQLNLPVLRRNFPVMVSGFNESQEYLVNIVKLGLLVGDKEFQIEAICIPEIRTKIVVPGLARIASAFKQKGYALIDIFLTDGTDCISDLDLIIGTNNPEILLERQIQFGHDKHVSVYSETHAGTMIYGCIDKLNKNMNFLPDLIRGNISVNLEYLKGRSVKDDSKSLVDEISDEINVTSNIASVVTDGIIDNEKLNEAVIEILNYDDVIYKEDSVQVDEKIVSYVLENTIRNDEGRFVMPLPWKEEAVDRLAINYNLSKQILQGSLKKLTKSKEKLEMMHEVFKEQLKAGIIEPVEEVDVRSGEFHFLPHMGVFKLDRATSKCRVVFLSNLSEAEGSQKTTFSHNQAMHAGPSLNQKITTAIMHLRFGEKMLTYDIKKAFNQIALYENDSNKLLFLWFKDPLNDDFTPVAFRNVKLTFGLRASPCILMIALYKLLCLDTFNDNQQLKEMKALLYALIYMDNGAYTGTAEQVQMAYDNLNNIFEPYGFPIQQITSNVENVQSNVDLQNKEVTADQVKLLGMYWHRSTDQLISPQIKLDYNASTKRQILQTLASQYDPFNLQGPILNRARLFLHSLQCTTELGWDEKLSRHLIDDWHRVVKQANSSPPIKIERNIGNRDDPFELLCFCDASHKIYATVIYLRNLKSGRLYFLKGTHRLVNKQLSLKTIPTLELQAVTLGVSTILDIKEELSSSSCVYPVQIMYLKVYTDSMICLQWLNSFSHKLDKMQKQSAFVLNRLEYIVTSCKEKPIQFNFIATSVNPADCLSRAVSHRTLTKMRYIEGPKPEGLENVNFQIVVPNPLLTVPESSVLPELSSFSSSCSETPHLIPTEKYSKFSKLVKVHARVLEFIQKLRVKIYISKNINFKSQKDSDLKNTALKHIIRTEQKIHYKEEYAFLMSPSGLLKDIPPLVSKLNIFLDDGMIKIKSKFGRFAGKYTYPILLPRSDLTNLIIRDFHEQFSHIGCYNLINHLRKEFYIPCVFSTVKKVLKSCIICKRLNGRSIKLNQSSYREFRVNPPCVPFQYIYMDYLGPITVKMHGQKQKIWLLIFTCMWSRSVNLRICRDLSVENFLRAFQSHVYDEGVPSKIISDLGSQFVPGSKAIEQYLNDPNTLSFLNNNNIAPVKFEQYFKGNSSLGSLVEVCVKFIKRLLFGSIRNNILDFEDFEVLISKTRYLINSRPVAFKNVLSAPEELDIPEPITPELLKRGRNIIAPNVVPGLQSLSDGEDDPNWVRNCTSADELHERFTKLRKVQKKIIDLYNREFCSTLLDQAIDKRDRYKPHGHKTISNGDIVLLKEQMLKIYQYPLAMVEKVHFNHQQEITNVEVRKGRTNELVKRHITTIIPYLSSDKIESTTSQEPPKSNLTTGSKRKTRQAALVSRDKTKRMLNL